MQIYYKSLFSSGGLPQKVSAYRHAAEHDGRTIKMINGHTA